MIRGEIITDLLYKPTQLRMIDKEDTQLNRRKEKSEKCNESEICLIIYGWWGDRKRLG